MKIYIFIEAKKEIRLVANYQIKIKNTLNYKYISYNYCKLNFYFIKIKLRINYLYI